MAKKKAHTKRKKRVAHVKRAPVKRRRKAVKRRAARKKVARRKPVKKKAPASRKRRVGKRVTKQVERKSVERTIQGTKRRRTRRHTAHRRVRLAGRGRSVGKSGNTGLILGLGLGALALYMLTRGSGSTTTSYANLPPLATTGNYTRDTQSQQLVNYAIAAGLTLNAISSLIKSLNTSSDNTVNNVYDSVNTTGSTDALAALPGFEMTA